VNALTQLVAIAVALNVVAADRNAAQPLTNRFAAGCIFSDVVELSDNQPQKVNSEIRGVQFNKLVAKVTQIPESIVKNSSFSLTTNYLFRIQATGLRDQQFESLGKRVEEYVGLRVEGHTASYASEALLQNAIGNAGPSISDEPDPFRAKLFMQFTNVLKSWIKEMPADMVINGMTNKGNGKRFSVQDGQLAWVYFVEPGNEKPRVIKVDAQEFDPNLIPKFRAAEREAKDVLSNENVPKGMGYSFHLWRETDAILLRKYGIKRKRFSELNSNIVF
jgi:hypothetical protein